MTINVSQSHFLWLDTSATLRWRGCDRANPRKNLPHFFEAVWASTADCTKLWTETWTKRSPCTTKTRREAILPTKCGFERPLCFFQFHQNVIPRNWNLWTALLLSFIYYFMTSDTETWSMVNYCRYRKFLSYSCVSFYRNKQHSVELLHPQIVRTFCGLLWSSLFVAI